MTDHPAETERRAAGARLGARADARPTGSNPAGLVNSTNNSAAPFQTAFTDALVDESTGELMPRWDPVRKWTLQAAAKKLLPDKRVSACMTAVRSDVGQVGIRQSRESGRCYYTGLMACGSVWACPICATKIQTVRALELKQAIAEAELQGLTVAMLAPTVPHTLQDNLRSLVDEYTRALGSLLNGRGFRKLKEKYGIEGYVRALEVTYGFRHGWHPHAHVLLFLRPDIALGDLEAELFPLWEKAVQGRGLGQVSRTPFKLQNASRAHSYVTKLGREWGAAEELVHSHSKQAKGSSYSPFDLLGEYAFGDQGDSRTSQFGALFREYAEVFHGRRQLQWTQGLKKRLVGTDGPTDGEIADSIGEVDPVLAELSLDDWLLVRKADLRGELLLVAELHGAAGILSTLDALRRRFPPPNRPGQVKPCLLA